MAFDSEVTGSVDEERTEDAACLDFGKVFDMASHNITDKPLKYRRDSEVDSKLAELLGSNRLLSVTQSPAGG